MELYQLEYVLAIAKHGKFAAAAESCNITPSALSQQIRKLEQEMGVALFVRTTRTVETTPAGKDFIQFVRRSLSELEHAKDTMQEYARAERGHLRIGNFPSLGAYGIIARIIAFQKGFPNVRLTFIEAECLNLRDMLEEGKIDAAFLTAITSMQPPKRVLEAYPITTSELVLEVSETHRFAARKSVEWSELAGESIITPPAFSGIRLDVDEAFHQVGVQPNYHAYTGSSDTVSSLTAAGVGASITSIHAYRKAVHEKTVCIPLSPKKIRTVYFAISKSRKPLPLLDNLKVYALQSGKDIVPEPIYIFPVNRG